MAFFFVRLLPNRPDFPQNLTPLEGAVMQRHAVHLREQLDRGTLVVAGPVLERTGAFGMGVFECDSREALDAILAADPVSELGRYEVSVMANAVARLRLPV